MSLAASLHDASGLMVIKGIGVMISETVTSFGSKPATEIHLKISPAVRIPKHYFNKPSLAINTLLFFLATISLIASITFEVGFTVCKG